MTSTNDEKPKVLAIPDNFGAGINIASIHFEPRHLFEGILLSVVLTYLMRQLILLFGYSSIEQQLGVCVITAGSSFVLGIVGINGEPVSRFFLKALRFNNNKRTCYYNSRVKIETMPLYRQKTDEIETKLRNPNKLKTFVDDLVSKFDEEEKKSSLEAIEKEKQDKFNSAKMFFIDDIQAANYIQKRDELIKEREKADAKKSNKRSEE